MNYYYIPQNAWGLVDADGAQNVGFYSALGGPCSPVAIWCEATSRAAYTHFDGNQHAVSAALADWLSDGSAHHELNVLGFHQPHLDAIKAQLEAVLEGAHVATLPEQEQFWGFRIDANTPVWVDERELPPEDLVEIPDSWHGYWDGAPEWVNGGTFTNAIADQLTGFIANYNGRFYFDFDAQ
ncbi:hypothetical protein [Xanthomonas sacchari]|uniref:hypothetical protein n=1 Tax=Xanthomonas sacchari TaxID=56458 RepID=UPI003528353C